MTTIAYRNGMLAADSRGTRADWIEPMPFQKLFRYPRGIVGISGNYADSLKLIQWLSDPERNAESLPTLAECSAIIVEKDKVQTYQYGALFDIKGQFWAIGSGMAAAHAAMYCGRNAVEAVKIAALMDTLTGGDIFSMELDQCQLSMEL